MKNIFSKKIFVCAAALILAAAAIKFYNIENSPRYAVNQAGLAVIERDAVKLARYADAEKIFEYAYDDTAKELAARVEELNRRYPEDFFFHHDSAFMEKYAQDGRALALSLWQGACHEYFTQENIKDTPYEKGKNPSKFLASEAKKLMDNAEAECVSIEEKDDRAVATIVIHGKDTDYGRLTNGLIFRLELGREDGDWRIIRIANIADAEELFLPIVDSAEIYWTLQGWQ